ncbi:HSP20 family molecular chaperone IbpA [Bacillus pakistanensis]|uniref:HSP20 family molecular chaperone IbpA n=1 Tax=Rossellomorea pakistanensis TaxID=992288 RepID=A0ABS2N7Q0_9BACI|nr:hypothetical protein [Bacillus pakistanensis]MBM7583885.1 HSP20 family molecular chaperone IbpA [Bacillus pakistanensis]
MASAEENDFILEDWECWMKKWLLDPNTAILDETQFRIDLFDTTNHFIIEVPIGSLDADEIMIKKEGSTLLIELSLFLINQHRIREIDFPFCLKNHQVFAKFQPQKVEIYIEKIKRNKPASDNIRIQGIHEDE